MSCAGYVTVSTEDCTKIVEVTSTSVVKVITEGPIGATGAVGPTGPQGPPGVAGSLDDVSDVDGSNKVDRSVLYYDAASSTFKLDAIVTTTTLTDGGNF